MMWEVCFFFRRRFLLTFRTKILECWSFTSTVWPYRRHVNSMLLTSQLRSHVSDLSVHDSPSSLHEHVVQPSVVAFHLSPTANTRPS